MNDTNTVTINEVRSKGYLVDVKHFRDHRVAYNDPLTNKLKVGVIRHVKEFVDNDSAKGFMLWELLAKGGRTEVTIKDPETKTEFWASAVCREDENYDKREGVGRCLLRLDGLMRVCDGKDGFKCKL